MIQSTVSTLDGKLDGDIHLITDTTVNTIAFQRHFVTPFGGSTYTLDTTIILNSNVINIQTLIYTEKFTGSIYDLDIAADTYMTVWVDGVKKLYLKDCIIAEDVNIK